MTSADKVVYRVLGNLGKGEMGISLEEILEELGIKRSVAPEFYRKSMSQENIKYMSGTIPGGSHSVRL